MAAAAEEAFVCHEGAWTLPTPDEIDQRVPLRGLGEELMRMDAENQRTGRSEHWGRFGGRFFFCSWFTGCRSLLRRFLQTAEPGLRSILGPFDDAALLEAHGEDILELLISKAPGGVWMTWLFTSLDVAARADNIEVFHRLFALCKNTPQFWAAERKTEYLLLQTAGVGSADVLSALLEVDVFRSDFHEVNRPHSPLICAAGNGHRSSVAVLVKAGAPLEHKGMLGATALSVAVEKGHEGVVLELLDAGADVNSTNDEGAVGAFKIMDYPNLTPLGIAAAKNNGRMVDILLAAGADFGENRTDILPLIIAAQVGCCGSLKRLLEAGADANVVNSRGQSALYKACEWIRDGAVELLLQHNASLTSRCDGGRSPRDVVARGAFGAHEGFRGLGRWRFLASLEAVNPAAPGRIRDMLRRASAWGRRGWLVMMRSRRLVPVQLLDESSLQKSPTAEHVPPGNDSDSKESKYDGVCIIVERLSLADVPSTGTSGGVDDQEQRMISTKANALSTSEGHDSGQQVRSGGGWECAVEWLLQCPDERGVFREILGFL